MWNRRSANGSRRRPERVATSTTLASSSAPGPAPTTSAAPAIRPSPTRKPTASSSSWPGVRIVTASARPSTRISSGSSTATSSRTNSRRSPSTRSIHVRATPESIASGIRQG